MDADDLRFIHLSNAQGLSQTRVQQIVQDDEGFLWFGTQYGLNRYDGYTFKVFSHDPSRVDSLGGVYIFALFKDRSGYLWVSSDEALDRFDPRTETFTHYRLPRPTSDEGDVTVFHINQDHEGGIWLATGAGLFRLDPATGRTTLFQRESSDPRSLASSDVKSTLEDRTHRFWVATRNGLDELDRSTGRVRMHVPIKRPVREFQIYEDNSGLLWLAYASGGGAGLSSYDPNSNVLSDYTFATKDIPGTAFTGVYAITQDREGALWIGTGGMGLLKLDRIGRRFLRYRHLAGDPRSISDDHVIALLEDGQGHMWVGLNATEPNNFALQAGSFRDVASGLGSQNGGEMLIGSIFKDRDGALWVGTTGLNRIDPRNGVSTYYPITQSTVSTGIIAIAQDPMGDLWLGTVGQGLKRYNPRTGTVKTYKHDPSDPNSLSDDVVSDLRFDGADTLWVSTWDGLNRFNIPKETFTVFRPDPRERTGRFGRTAQDAHGSMWIAGTSGLTRFESRTSRFFVAKHADGKPTISSDVVTFVFIDSDGQLWIATRNGLDKLNADGTYTGYRERDGLGGNSVSCILEDNAGRLWLGTNKGLSRFDRESHLFTNYSAADGLGDLTGWNTCLNTSTGEVFFAGFSGIVAFYPEKIGGAVSRAPIRFTDLKIRGQSVPIGIGSVLTRSIGHTDAITLFNDQRDFSLEFASLSFASRGSVRYRYKMEGLDSQWNELGVDRRVVSYSGLPPGGYTFHAQAAVGRATWSEPGATLRIRVRPTWWQSWWFTAAVGALLIIFAWAMHRERLRQIGRQFGIRLEERVNERTRIARDLHDTLLQSFQGLLLRFQTVYELLPQRPADAKETLASAIDRTAQAITEGREAVQGLRASTVESNDLAIALTSLGEALATEAGAESSTRLRVQLEGTSRTLHPIVRDEIYRIADEALRNAFRHAGAKEIELELRYDERQLRVRVRDDGKGIDLKFLATEGRTGHFGLHGMRERAELIGGKLTVWSAPGSGTEIEFTIPAARAYADPVAPRRAWFGERPAKKSPQSES